MSWQGNRAGGDSPFVHFYNEGEYIDGGNMAGYVAETGAGHTVVFTDDVDEIRLEITANASSTDQRTWMYTDTFDFTDYDEIIVKLYVQAENISRVHPTIATQGGIDDTPSDRMNLYGTTAYRSLDFQFTDDGNQREDLIWMGADISAIGSTRLYIGGDMQRQSTSNPRLRVKEIILKKAGA